VLLADQEDRTGRVMLADGLSCRASRGASTNQDIFHMLRAHISVIGPSLVNMTQNHASSSGEFGAKRLDCLSGPSFP
jgi:hypothetical protein